MIEPFYTTDLGTLYCGDALDVLQALPDTSVQCCVTSPPYWGLRDYGTATWEGGDLACEHRVGNQVQDNKAHGAITTGIRPGVNASVCRICGGCRIDQQLGLESTPEAYVAKMVEVFREVRRVLRQDGTLWLNLGDSYASTGRSDRKESPGVGAKQEMFAPGRTLKWQAGGGHNFAWSIPSFGTQIKPKDLIGIPWRIAFALQADGWWLRSDIIWAKPNPMPESVTDRPTKAHEYLFLMAKAGKYFYDADAISETLKTPPHKPGNKILADGKTDSGYMQNRVWATNGKRNRRSVWSVATQPFPEAHFATFPPKLIEPCILAGARMGDTVLDPFMGAGTVGLVCERLNRRWIGIELSQEYCEIAKGRIDPIARQGKLFRSRQKDTGEE